MIDTKQIAVGRERRITLAHPASSRQGLRSAPDGYRTVNFRVSFPLRLFEGSNKATTTEKSVACRSSTSAREPFQVSEGGQPSTSGRDSTNGHSSSLNGDGVHASNGAGLDKKSQTSQENMVDYDATFSREAQERIMPGLRVLATKFTGIPGIIPLQGGLPPSEAFPLESIQLRLSSGDTVDIAAEEEVVAAQQYNLTMKGHASLLRWVEEHTQRMHSPPAQYETVVTSGSNYTIEIIMRMFMEPGDSILCEEYTYPHVPESMVLPVGYQSVGVQIDEHGIIPELLQISLEQLQEQGCKLPRLLYTIPTGQNPTGATQTLERKEAVYRICRRFGIIILEDDPYFYLQYTPGQAPRGLQGLGRSYLSMDTDHRVIRLDSFSKSLAPGLRVGWLTAHPAVATKFLYHLHGVAMGACSLSQVVLGALLTKMGEEGFEAHIKKIQEQYSRRAGLAMQAAERHLTGLADWAPVGAGMFLWIKLRGFADASQILDDLQEAKVVVVPGGLTRHTGPDATLACPYVRISFVTAPEELLDVAIERLAGVLRKFNGQNKPRLRDLPPTNHAANEEEVL